jgi:nitroreductase
LQLQAGILCVAGFKTKPARLPDSSVGDPPKETALLIEKLNWRYATKKMDPSKPVTEDKVARILEAARLAPTSSGLQPFEIIVVTNPEVRAKIQEIAWNQAQITDGSHLLVFAAWDNYTAERINGMFDLVNAERGIKNEGWENYRQMLLNMYPPRDAQVNFEHAARQAYIGFGMALAQAAFEGVDSTPMEGFDPDKLDEILGLREKGLRSVTILPLGYRKEDGDWLVNLKKVRRPNDQFISSVK